jgi:hypothetical protein
MDSDDDLSNYDLRDTDEYTSGEEDGTQSQTASVKVASSYTAPPFLKSFGDEDDIAKRVRAHKALSKRIVDLEAKAREATDKAARAAKRLENAVRDRQVFEMQVLHPRREARPSGGVLRRSLKTLSSEVLDDLAERVREEKAQRQKK